MSLIKRFTVAVSTRLDRLVGDLENHDAVVEVGIRESRRLYAQAKVRYQRLQRDGEALRRQLEERRTDERNWRERALSCEPNAAGEEKALQCLKRARQAAREAASLEQAWQQHQSVERRLAADIDALRERVAQLAHRRSLMRSREATADAAVRVREAECDPQLDLDETFERWEIRLTEAEMAADQSAQLNAVGLHAVGSDPFEEEFLVAEERAALHAELTALRRGHADANAAAAAPAGGVQ
ncbi:MULTISPECIES: PspA/IM30 family protein [Thiorhodovibrio]|uniref:PspA/IM30 family protein n=1 Tax=Thiorhodovibrio TaxID=61593 RepID=UPI00191142DC|nr:MULTISPECIES: hypothetical protein [Thiorhodovibrio]MBK5968472.1 hypothetical protein [Thiorhodovibrio winogradskyi]WPL11116.1 phage shock protein A [Thiorhodovibrio litoralis]